MVRTRYRPCIFDRLPLTSDGHVTPCGDAPPTKMASAGPQLALSGYSRRKPAGSRLLSSSRRLEPRDRVGDQAQLRESVVQPPTSKQTLSGTVGIGSASLPSRRPLVRRRRDRRERPEGADSARSRARQSDRKPEGSHDQQPASRVGLRIRPSSSDSALRRMSAVDRLARRYATHRGALAPARLLSAGTSQSSDTTSTPHSNR